MTVSKYHNFKKYDFKNRWVSYWHQIDEVLELNPKNVLEIGVGNRTVSNYLKNKNIDLTTLDIDRELEPDIVGNILALPLQDNSFDVILCAEVLEHLPFDNFEQALRELRRVAKRHIVLSLPHFGPSFRISFKAPFLREKKFAFKIWFPLAHYPNRDHQWEIGKKGYSIGRIKNIIRKYFIIKKEFVPFEIQYHHFFILEKND